MSDPLEGLWEECREAARAGDEGRLNGLLGIAGDLLEDRGDPQALLCRVRWAVTAGQGSSSTCRYFKLDGVKLTEYRHQYFVVESTEPLLFIPAANLTVSADDELMWYPEWSTSAFNSHTRKPMVTDPEHGLLRWVREACGAARTGAGRGG